MMIITRNEPLRLAFYSHNTQGLGHIRRNLTIAAALAERDEPPAMLLISGTQLGSAFEQPPGADFLALPSVAKGSDGSYRAQSLPMSLDALVDLRMHTICAALETFQPDVFIVDKVAGGFAGELIPALDMLRRRGRTRVVLGLRDVLDDAQTTRREWVQGDYSRILAAYYDAIWVYGDPHVYDPIQAYELEIDRTVDIVYTDYLVRPTPQSSVVRPRIHPLRQQHVLCMLGGGQDGDAVAEALLHVDLPRGFQATLLAGPYMSAQEYASLVARSMTYEGQRW